MKCVVVACMVAAVAACTGDAKPPPRCGEPGAPTCPPPPPPVSTTTLAVRVTEAGRPVAARVLLVDANGQPVRMGNIDVFGQRQGAAACEITPGVVGSWDGLILATGLADVPVGVDRCVPSPAIPYGKYKVIAWRGIEYERWEGEVDLSAQRGRVELAIALERAWTPTGTLAADLHVHARASNDSTVPNPQRVVAQVAAGIQVVALSDHNINGDLDAEITELGLDGVIASIASNEVSNQHMHVGVYPVVVDKTKPNNGAISEAELMDSGEADAAADAKRVFKLLRKLPGRPVVQLNHPRLRWASLYDGAAWDGETWPPPFALDFDAVEVLAGYTAFNVEGDRRFDDSVRDYLTLLDHGKLVTPLGNSDTHDLNWVLDGTTRTYVYVETPALAPFDEPAFVRAIRDRRVIATSGPWLDVRASATETAEAAVGPGQQLPARGRIWLDVTVAQARFVQTERIRVIAGTPRGPALVQTIDVPPGVRTHHWAGWIDVGTRDTYVVVTADGDTPMPVELTGSYQQERWNRPGVTPYALASPILIDADRNGRWRRRR